ncbi:MAG: hypothetical protein R6W84_08285 [Promethearchaeia archaeon]
MSRLKNDKSSSVDIEEPLGNFLSDTDCLFIRKIYERFGKEPIFDSQNNIVLRIGNYSHIGNGNYYLELDEKTRYFVNEKEWSLSKVHFLMNKHGKIATMQRKVLSFSPQFYLSTMNGNRVLETKEKSFERTNFEIKTPSKNTPICRIKLIKSRQGKTPDAREYLKVEFFDHEINKILLISFILYIRKLTMLYNGISDVANYGRKIVRLRPFGPKVFK